MQLVRQTDVNQPNPLVIDVARANPSPKKPNTGGTVKRKLT